MKYTVKQLMQDLQDVLDLHPSWANAEIEEVNLQITNLVTGEYCVIDENDNEPEEDYEEPADLEMGFDPYMGCYTDEC